MNLILSDTSVNTIYLNQGNIHKAGDASTPTSRNSWRLLDMVRMGSKEMKTRFESRREKSQIHSDPS